MNKKYLICIMLLLMMSCGIIFAQSPNNGANKSDSELNGFPITHILMLQNLQTCTPFNQDTNNGLFYTIENLGEKCILIMQDNQNHTIQCNFPMEVAKQYADYALNTDPQAYNIAKEYCTQNK